MKKVDLSWFVKEPDDIYVAHTEYYAGTCNPKEDFLIDVEVWNNRWNIQEDSANAINSKLVIDFANAEDSVLLNICEVSIDGGIFIKPDLSEFGRGIINIGEISGVRNNGHERNVENYKRITIKFGDIPENFKSGLKSLFLDIQYDEE